MAPAASAFPSTHMTVTTAHSPIRDRIFPSAGIKTHKQNHPMNSLLQDNIQKHILSLALQEGCCEEQEPAQHAVAGQSTCVLRCEAEVMEIRNAAIKHKNQESQLIIRPPITQSSNRNAIWKHSSPKKIKKVFTTYIHTHICAHTVYSTKIKYLTVYFPSAHFILTQGYIIHIPSYFMYTAAVYQHLHKETCRVLLPSSTQVLMEE